MRTLILGILFGANIIGAQEWLPLVGPETAPSDIAPILAPFDMPPLDRPRFPDKTYSIVDFGGLAGGNYNNREAINAAIFACAESGGGRVLIPEGVWLTGAIHLRSNVNLHLARGAIVKFSDNPEDYLPVVFTRWAGFECQNYSPLIYARDCENIAITGDGILEGNGQAWWPWVDRQADTAQRMYQEQILKGIPPEQRIYGTPIAGLRPQMISPIQCSNVLLEGFTIREPGPFWTIDLVYCDRVIVRKLHIMSEGGPNTDGINVDSSRNVLIEHCFLSTGDDCVCMKSGMNEDGWRVGKPTENVVVRYIRTARGHGGIVFGSDMSGDIRNVYVHSCLYDGTDMGIRLKSTRGRGGIVENLWFENITMRSIRGTAVQISTSYRAWMGTEEGKAPIFRNIVFRSITVESAKQSVAIEGLPEAPVSNLLMKDVFIRAKQGMSLGHVENLQLENVTCGTETLQ